jgi:hypothetical protein
MTGDVMHQCIPTNMRAGTTVRAVVITNAAKTFEPGTPVRSNAGSAGTVATATPTIFVTSAPAAAAACYQRLAAWLVLLLLLPWPC